MQHNTRTVEEWFHHYDADEVKSDLGHVSGWVPTANIDPLLNNVDDAMVQYYTEDGFEGFVTTL